MEPAVWGFIGVIVGGVITGLVTLGVELIRAHKAEAFDSAKRQDERQLGRDQFQRETLLKFQDAVNDFMRGLAHVENYNAKVAHRVARPSEPVRREFNEAALRVGTLSSRIDSPVVREAAAELMNEGAAIAKGQDSDEAMKEIGETSLGCLFYTGELIRETFKDPAARMVEPVFDKPGISEPD